MFIISAQLQLQLIIIYRKRQVYLELNVRIDIYPSKQKEDKGKECGI